MQMTNCLYHPKSKAHIWRGHIHLFHKWGGLTVLVTAGYCSNKCSDWPLEDSGNLGDCDGCCGYRESVEVSL